MGIPDGHVIKVNWWHKIKNTDGWVDEERDLCRSCGNQFLKDSEKWLKKNKLLDGGNK